MATRLRQASLRFFFRHLYTDMARLYDGVAFVVSSGQWARWIRSVLPYLEGTRVLELGHGPGYLQQWILERGTPLAVGLDPSAAMGALARRRGNTQGGHVPNLVRGRAEGLPFADEVFDTVVSTFPTEFIFADASLAEIRRVLVAGGRLVVLPAAWIAGKHVLDRAAAWLFRVTQQAPLLGAPGVIKRLGEPLTNAGLQPEFYTNEPGSSLVLIAVARKL